MKRLAAVDNTLEKLGTPKIYQKLHACAKKVLIGYVFDMIWWFYVMEDHRCIILPCITNHFHHVNMLMDLLIMIFLWCV